MRGIQETRRKFHKEEIVKLGLKLKALVRSSNLCVSHSGLETETSSASIHV